MNILKKNNYLYVKILFSAFLVAGIVITAIFVENRIVKVPQQYDFLRYSIYLFITVFILANIWFDHKKIWKFIHRYRYLIGLIIFCILVGLGVNNSSSGVLASEIQPNMAVENSFPFWGILRQIKTDEYLATTPTLLSQSVDGTYNAWNDLIMAKMSPLTMQPKVTTFHISVLASPQLLGFFLLGPVRGFSFNCYFTIFLAFFATYELLRLITKDNRFLSVIGTVVIVFSPTSLWWGNFQFVGYGFVCLILFDKLIKTDKHWLKLLYALFIGWSFACFAMLMYPAWMVPYGYFYLVILAWIIYDNRKIIKIRYFAWLLISSLVVCAFVIPAFLSSTEIFTIMSNTVYPGSRSFEGGDAWIYLFQWLPSSVYSVVKGINVCEGSQYLSLFPVPIIISIVVIIKGIKNKNNDVLLIMLTAYCILLSIWNFIPIGIFAKLTFLSMSMPQRTANVVSLVSIFILIRILSNHSDGCSKLSKGKSLIAIVVSGAFVCLVIYLNRVFATDYCINSKKYLIVLGFAFCIIIALLIINNKKTRYASLCLLGLIATFCFLSVQPASVGLDSYFNKPVSQEIQNEVKQNRDNVWLSIEDNTLANFTLANGAKVINSVNYYPNLELWHKIDPDEQYNDIYNRYAHVNVAFTNEKSNFELVYPDSIKLNLSVNDLEKLGVNRLISHNTNLENLSTSETKIHKTYDEDGMAIYSVDYL